MVGVLFVAIFFSLHNNKEDLIKRLYAGKDDAEALYGCFTLSFILQSVLFFLLFCADMSREAVPTQIYQNFAFAVAVVGLFGGISGGAARAIDLILNEAVPEKNGSGADEYCLEKQSGTEPQLAVGGTSVPAIQSTALAKR